MYFYFIFYYCCRILIILFCLSFTFKGHYILLSLDPLCPSPTITKINPTTATATVFFCCKTFHVAKVAGTFDFNSPYQSPFCQFPFLLLHFLFSSLPCPLFFFSLSSSLLVRTSHASSFQVVVKLCSSCVLTSPSSPNLAFHRCKREPVQQISEPLSETG